MTREQTTWGAFWATVVAVAALGVGCGYVQLKGGAVDGGESAEASAAGGADSAGGAGGAGGGAAAAAQHPDNAPQPAADAAADRGAADAGGATPADPPCAATKGQACGSCGGMIQCSGACSFAGPGNLGQPCGSCGGTVQCDGSCSVPTPGNLGQGCGSCGGTIQCSGACSFTGPGNLGQACGSCGGAVQCDGSCSVATPGNFGQGCGSCGGTIQCGGACSIATPPDLGTVITAYAWNVAWSNPPGTIAQNSVVGGTCYAQYVRHDATAQLVSGAGTCEVLGWRSDDPHDCAVNVSVISPITLPPPTCRFTVTEERACN